MIEKVLEDLYGKFPGFPGLVRFCKNNNILSLEDIPICKRSGCNNFVTYKKDRPTQGLGMYCSPACSRSDKTVSKDILIYLDDEEWLRYQIEGQIRSKNSIAKEFGISAQPITSRMEKFGIVLPTDYSYVKNTKFEIDRETLYDMYHNQKMSPPMIGKALGTTCVTILARMAEHGIEQRSRSENQSMFSTTKGKIKPIIIVDRSELVNLYVEEKWPMKALAKKYKCHEETIRRFLQQEGVEAFHKRSILEHRMIEFSKTLGIEFQINNRQILPDRKEIDIYYPEFKIGLEINSFYHHSKFKGKKPNDYHHLKYKNSKDLGIRLFQFWQDEIEDKSEIVFSMIRNACKLNTNTIYARKCEIKDVSYSEAKKFYEENHIQGSPGKNTKSMGLYYNNELVSCIGYILPFDDTTIITRFCSVLNSNVVGAFSKLLKRIPGNLIKTYSHNDISEGNLYSSNGFEMVSQTRYDLWYTDFDRLHNRQKFMKKYLIDWETYSENKSETQIMVDSGYDIIYRSGTKTWVLER